MIAKLNFQLPLLQSLVSFKNHSNMLIWRKKKTFVLVIIFVKTETTNDWEYLAYP